MAVGQVGQRGAAVQTVFAREISAFEQELAPIRYRVMMGSTVMEIMPSSWIVWVSTQYFKYIFSVLFTPSLSVKLKIKKKIPTYIFQDMDHTPYHMKALFISFYLNGHTLGVHPHIVKRHFS